MVILTTHWAQLFCYDTLYLAVRKLLEEQKLLKIKPQLEVANAFTADSVENKID